MVDIFTNCCALLLIRRKGQNMTVLVTGGCGYIGAHVVHALHQAGEKVVVVDDLSYGKPTRIEGSRLYGMDIAAPGAGERLAEIMKAEGVDSVIHFSAASRSANPSRSRCGTTSRTSTACSTC